MGVDPTQVHYDWSKKTSNVLKKISSKFEFNACENLTPEK